MRYLFWIYAVFHVCCPFVEFPIKKQANQKCNKFGKESELQKLRWTLNEYEIEHFDVVILYSPSVGFVLTRNAVVFWYIVIAYRFFFEIKTIFHFTLGIPRASLCSHPYEFKVFYVCVFIYLFIYFFIQMLVLILKKYYGAYSVYLTFFYVL